MLIAIYLRRAIDPTSIAVDGDLVLDPWQAELMRSTARQVLLLCSRQSGKSTVCALIAIATAIMAAGAPVPLSPLARDIIASVQPPHWMLHDLRRTCATGMAELGIEPHVVEDVLNHIRGAKAGVAGTYNRAAFAPEKKAALDRGAAYIEGLVCGRDANVRPLQRAR
jgi:hypothetical protein